MQLSEATFRFGEALTRALLGLDALYANEQGKDRRGQGGDIERLVVLDMSRGFTPDPFGDYAQAIERFTVLRAEAEVLPAPDRRLYYRQTCDSAIAFASWRLDGLPFPDQIARFLHVPAEPASDTALDAIKGQMHSVLDELGYSGDLDDQFAAWEKRQRVAPEDVEAVLESLLSEAWDRTANLMAIPAPKSDGMRVETVTAVPYNAMCDYSRRLIRLNTDPTLTVPGLRHLAVHEGYPGHYVQFKRREVGYQRGEVTADALLSVVNTASSSPFEGIADIGLQVIGWDTTLDDRLSGLVTRYRSGLGTRAAWRLHADGWTTAQVREELLRDALTGGEGWVDNRIRFVQAHDRAALIWSYWWGLPSVQVAWNRVVEGAASIAEYAEWTYDRMHSAASIAMFGADTPAVA